jgi:predicted component of type VI protein secretion system
MSNLQPVSVALKFGFLAVLYLFLLWIARSAPGHAAGMIYDIGPGAVLGRGDSAEIRLNDPFASSRHARIALQGGVVVLEDLGSTNGTYLNEELLHGLSPLHHGDRVRIGDSEFTYEDA